MTIEELEKKVSELTDKLTASAEEVEKVKAKNKELLEEKQEKTKEAKAAEEAMKKAAEETAKKLGDIESLEKSWQDKLDKQKQEYEAKLQNSQKWIQDLTVNSVASSLAGELAVQGSASVLLPHISKRLKVEEMDGKPVTRVLDKNGQPCAMTIKELSEEFKTDKSFAPLIIGTNATGGGAPGERSAPSNDSMMKLSPTERMRAARAAKVS